MKNLLFLILLTTVLLYSCQSEEEDETIDWVLVEGGTYLQGENQNVISPNGDTIEGFTSPQRKVKIDSFYISKYEITVEQFRSFCEATGREMPDPPLLNAYGRLNRMGWKDDHPMLATWQEAHDFAEWVGGRLPTEAEWEYAAKGGNRSKGFRYSGSNDPREVGWVFENADSSYHPVGQLKPNELGIYDMTGNVNEWVQDWYNPELDNIQDTINPTGPDIGLDSMKISKGLSWYYEGAHKKTGEPLEYGIHMPEVRYQSPIFTRNDGFGFRVARDVSN